MLKARFESSRTLPVIGANVEVSFNQNRGGSIDDFVDVGNGDVIYRLNYGEFENLPRLSAHLVKLIDPVHEKIKMSGVVRSVEIRAKCGDIPPMTSEYHLIISVNVKEIQILEADEL